MSWSDIQKRAVVVVLGEPGSGKTWEFQHQADLLLARGEFGFFVRLDRMVSETLDDVLTIEERKQYGRWRGARWVATFFLDSVDEAKFRRDADFHTALRRFRDALGYDGARRSKWIVSSRISEWHPETDERALMHQFPHIRSTESGIRSGGAFKVEEEEHLDDQRNPLVVHLEPLDRDRVAKYARERGISNPDAFLKALTDAWAWEFARRPIDVVDLVNYWMKHGNLGSFTQLLDHNVEINLHERHDRARTDPLTADQARTGAEALRSGHRSLSATQLQGT